VIIPVPSAVASLPDRLPAGIFIFLNISADWSLTMTAQSSIATQPARLPAEIILNISAGWSDSIVTAQSATASQPVRLLAIIISAD
jgi:hypothetical protein